MYVVFQFFCSKERSLRAEKIERKARAASEQILRRPSSSKPKLPHTHHRTRNIRVPSGSLLVRPSFRPICPPAPCGLYVVRWTTDPDPRSSKAGARQRQPGCVFTTSARQVLRSRGCGSSSYCTLVLVVFHDGQVFPSWAKDLLFVRPKFPQSERRREESEPPAFSLSGILGSLGCTGYVAALPFAFRNLAYPGPRRFNFRLAH